MLIEEIPSNETTIFMAIEELMNTKSLRSDELILIAENARQNLHALQLFNPRAIAGAIHLISAVSNAVNAQNSNYMISRSLDVEIALYASTQRQISKAFEMVGIENTPTSVIAVGVGVDETILRNVMSALYKVVGPSSQPMFEFNRTKLRHLMILYDVSEVELDTLTDSSDIASLFEALNRCIVSRVSLVAVEN